MNKEVTIKGFTRYEISDKEFEKFIKETKKDYYVVLKNTKDMKIFLEIQDKDLKKIKNTICYVFYNIQKTINFKTTDVIFKKETTKQEIIKIKQEIVKEILNKIDDIYQSLSPEDYLDKLKFKYI